MPGGGLGRIIRNKVDTEMRAGCLWVPGFSIAIRRSDLAYAK